MKKYLNKIMLSCLVALTVILPACTSLSDVFLKSSPISDEINSGRALRTVSSVELNPVQEQIVTHASNQFDGFRIKWQEVMGQPSLLPSDKEQELLADYNKLRDRYQEVSKIVQENWGEYDPITQKILLDYQMKAQILDNKVIDFIQANHMRSAANEALFYAATISEIIMNLR